MIAAQYQFQPEKKMLCARYVLNRSKLGTLFGTRHLKEFYTPMTHGESLFALYSAT